MLRYDEYTKIMTDVVQEVRSVKLWLTSSTDKALVVWMNNEGSTISIDTLDASFAPDLEELARVPCQGKQVEFTDVAIKYMGLQLYLLLCQYYPTYVDHQLYGY